MGQIPTYREKFVDETGQVINRGAGGEMENPVSQETLSAYEDLRGQFTSIKAKVLMTLKQHETGLPHGGPKDDDTLVMLYLLAQTVVRMTQPRVASPFIQEPKTQQKESGDLAVVLREIMDRLSPKKAESEPDDFLGDER